MKLYLIAKGLREGTYVKKAVRLDRPRTLNEFLAIAKIYTGMWRWEKHKKGGVELCSQKLFVPYVEELFSGSESEVIQSLSEFRVVCSG